MFVTMVNMAQEILIRLLGMVIYMLDYRILEDSTALLQNQEYNLYIVTTPASPSPTVKNSHHGNGYIYYQALLFKRECSLRLDPPRLYYFYLFIL